MAYKYYNPNKMGKDVGDCVIRGLCKVEEDTMVTTI